MKKKKIWAVAVAKLIYYGDMYKTDPVCSKSPEHGVIEAAIDSAAKSSQLAANEQPLVFRNSKNSRQFIN